MKNVISLQATIVKLLEVDKPVKSHSMVQMGTPLIQRQENRSIALYKDNERHLMMYPVSIDRELFKKSEKERADLKLAKKWWRSLLPPNYKPQLLIRA